MRSNKYQSLRLFLFLVSLSLCITVLPVYAEIYRWVDDHGRVQFSDSPDPNYRSQGIKSGPNPIKNKTDVKKLEDTAKQLKKNRLDRKKMADKRAREARNKRQMHEKAIAKKKKRKADCEDARKKENLAFRQRSKSGNLIAIRKALAKYEKKRKIRIIKCQ